MDIHEVQNQLSCAMCFFKCQLNDELIRHYIRYHKHDPQFRVRCVYEECGATYHKWKSFTEHFRQRHSNAVRILDNVGQDFEDLPPEEILHDNIAMEQEDLIEEDNNPGKIIR